MATTRDCNNSEMTGEAFDLLDCFVSGLDDVVYEIAENIAKENGQVTEEGFVKITGGDVKNAAKLVFDAIREQAGKSIPNEAVEHIEQMHECVMSKCELHDAGK